MPTFLSTFATGQNGQMPVFDMNLIETSTEPGQSMLNNDGKMDWR